MATNPDFQMNGTESESSVTHDATVSPALTAVSNDSWTGKLNLAARETLHVHTLDPFQSSALQPRALT
jgi:hypothetical protein